MHVICGDHRLMSGISLNSFPPHFKRCSLLLTMNFSDSDAVTGQRAPGVHLSPSNRATSRFCSHSFYRAARDLNSRQVMLAQQTPLQLAKTFFFKKRKENDNNFDELGFASYLISCFKSILITLYKINSKTEI